MNQSPMFPPNRASVGGTMLTGLFGTREAAERAFRAAEVRGYTRDEVNVLMSDQTRALYYPGPEGALAGAGIGTAVGGALGALVAAVSAIGTNLVLPGLGLVIAGPLAAGFAGAGAGGLAGGFIGALVGAGIPEERAREYESGIRRGGIVLGLRARTDEDARWLEEEWQKQGGQFVHR